MALGDVNADILQGYWTQAEFDANPTFVLGAGQIIHLEQTGKYKLGDGTTQLSALSFLGGSGGGGAVDSVNGQTGVVVLDAGDILMANSQTVEEALNLALSKNIDGGSANSVYLITQNIDGGGA